MNPLKKLTFVVLIVFSATISALATQYTIGDAVTVQETGVDPNKIVTINSSLLSPYNIDVYAGITQLNVNGVATNSFCIDPYQYSSNSSQQYTVKDLASAPSPAMGSDAALTVSKLWAGFYSQALLNAGTAAGLQIAIWETVAGNNFYVVGSDYGAKGMIAAVSSPDFNVAPADLVALSSADYQDYVVQNVPDTGATIALLGLALIPLAVVGRRPRPVPVRVD